MELTNNMTDFSIPAASADEYQLRMDLRWFGNGLEGHLPGECVVVAGEPVLFQVSEYPIS